MKEISSKLTPVDMEFSNYWLLRPYHDQRPISPATWQRYKADMMAVPCRWNIGEGQIVIGTIAGSDQEGVLLAGRHRLTAVFEAQTITILMRVSFYEFENEAEMAKFYAEGTNKGKSMSLAASLQVLGTGEAVGIPPFLLPRYASAFGFISNQFHMSGSISEATIAGKNPEVVDTVMREWQGSIYAFHLALAGLSNKERNAFVRVPVLAVALLTLRFQPARAEPFWRETAGNNGLRKGEPQHALFNYVLQTELGGSKEYEVMTAAVANCWNGYWKRQPVNAILPKNARGEKGLILLGTPYTGKAHVDPLVILGVKEGKGAK